MYIVAVYLFGTITEPRYFTDSSNQAYIEYSKTTAKHLGQISQNIFEAYYLLCVLVASYSLYIMYKTVQELA